MVEMYVDEIYTFLISQSHTNEDRAMFLSDLINPTYKGNNLKHLSGIFGLKFKLVDFLYKHPDKFGVTYNKDSKPIGVYAVIPPPPPIYSGTRSTLTSTTPTTACCSRVTCSVSSKILGRR